MSEPTPRARFTDLFEATYQPLLGYAVRRVADPQDAADVVAEAYLVAWRRLDDVPTGPDARPWMFGVARNVLANYYRSERRRTALAARLRETLVEDLPVPDRGPTTLDLAMDRLGDDDRELLRLLAWEGLAREEIAMVLRVPRATVRVRLHRARRRLAAAMAEIEAAEGARVGTPRVANARVEDTRKRSAARGHVRPGRALGLPQAEEA